MSESPSANPGLENIDIQRILPHRFPMLLVDRVVEHQRKQRIVAIKNVTANEPFFMGHFPGFPIMPGVLIVEALAQAGGLLLLSEIEDRDSKLMVFSGIDNARFRKPVLPGDTLRLEVNVIGWRSSFAKMEGKAYVGEQLVAEAVLSCALVPRQDKKQASEKK
jgi:3-hydroxyacyl-[acyl-carrier-protein] dehydratase